MEAYQKLLLSNKAWVKEKLEVEDNFFEKHLVAQQPDFLWIGCSDSRVPAEDITGTGPGELFVHRNIANLVVHTDFNLMSVLQYAVEYLKVKHIIVCGHTGCGGVRAALGHQRFGLLNQWLRQIKDVYHQHHSELSLYSDDERKVDRLVELNVMEQVQNLSRTSIIQSTWNKEKRPTIHGWVYDMPTGHLKDLLMVNYDTKVDSIYRFEF